MSFQLQAAPLLGSSVLEPVVPVVPVVLFVSKRIPQLAVIEKPVRTYVYYFYWFHWFHWFQCPVSGVVAGFVLEPVSNHDWFQTGSTGSTWWV